MLEQENIYLEFELKGNIFKEINDQYYMEQECMKSGSKMLQSKLCRMYMEVFECNSNITVVKAETFGDIIIDDNHIVVEWDINGCILEFYYEQYWDYMSLTISRNGCENALLEIVRAFENYYGREFKYSIEKNENNLPGYDAKPIEFLKYKLCIEE
ncbi:MAG: hypothetical protein IKJ39_01645 [Lachnospiraceae bacterium]|nr:hypothetical protein [Lachnospiraceae bacterium]